VTRLDKLEGEELSSQSSEAKRTPSGDPSGAQQGKHPQEASAPTPTTLLDDTGPRAKDTRAAAGPDHDRDAKLLGYLQELERLHPELKLNGAGDVRLALQQGRIAELRAQRDLERAFGQTRIVVIDEQLRIAAMKARRRQQQSLLLVGLLIPVAVFVVGLLYSARLGDNQVLWAIAGTTFFMSYAAIVVFAVTSLGTVAEMVQLIRTQFRAAEQTPAEPTTTGSNATLSFDELRDRYGQHT
jgi:hypothetical protein